ncbi:hypothetical protein A0H81_08851 [Grifola frondosa]|uniref:F-box domain-containing protein n=1 Tax=Grifola frondosa TaxID=5627 RepID=A0A1C7M3A3_GRIFR|nr:hypothetical protein A0H81_08851 [Grifola frondosa]
MRIQFHKPDVLLIESPTSTALDLDLDVMYIILSILPRPDLVRLMSTCRTFNRAGVRHLLHFNVHLNHIRTLKSFCAFMVAQAPIRYPFLRRLSIYRFCPPPPYKSVNQLIKILKHASHLEMLYVESNDPLDSEDRLQAACSSLTSLKEFHISWMSGRVSGEEPLYKMVEQMQSLPSIFHATLEDLTLYTPTFQSELLFPRMRKLSVRDANPPLALIAQNFPALLDLTILNCRGDDASLSPEDHQDRQLHRSVQLSGGGWKSLDRLAGGAFDLYRLGLTCQIRWVTIFDVDSCTHDVVAHILRDSHEVAARLTYLRCTIDLAFFDGIPSALDTFRLLLQRSPLTHLMLRFTAYASMDTVGARLVREFRPEVFASQIIASHPSIRYIVIKINHAEQLFWKVLTTESGEVVVDKALKEDISVVMDL